MIAVTLKVGDCSFFYVVEDALVCVRLSVMLRLSEMLRAISVLSQSKSQSRVECIIISRFG